jgi:arylsulfatase
VPLQAPDSLIKYYSHKFGNENPYLGEMGYFPTRYPRATYAAMVTYLDNQVGLIVQKLKDLGIYDNTIIIFTSDNGPTYAGGADSRFFDSAAPFSSIRGRGKGSVYEGGIRVPLIVQWPDEVLPGSTSDHPGVFYDLFPTICELAGIKTEVETDGLSLLPVFTGSEYSSPHEFLYWEYPASGGQQAVRMDNWKGIRRNMFKGNLDIELYDLSSDIKETRNVAAENPDIVKKIERIMNEEHEPSKVERFKFEILED